MEEMKPDTEVKEETSVPEEGAAEATAEKPAKKPHGFVQFIWFIVMSLIAFALQMIIAQFGDDLLALCGVANEGEFIKVGLDSLTLAGFIAYLVANIVAKVISYILNRKKTFAAVNNLAFSFSVYVIMCVALIVAETFIAAPIQNFWIGIGVPESWAGMVTVITYSIPDFLIVFLMEKFVIMNNKLFAKKEEVAAADETAVAVDTAASDDGVITVAPVVADEAVAEEAPAVAAEEAPVEQAAEETAVEEAQSEEAVEEVAEAVEEATPVEEVVTEEPLAETPQEEQAIAEAEAAEEQTPSDEAPAAIEEAPVEEVAAEEPVAEEAQEAVAEEAPVEEAAPAEEAVAEAAPEAVAEEEVAAAPVEEKPAKKAPAKKPAAKKAADKKPAAKKSDAKKPAAKKAAPKKEEPKKEEAKEAAPSNVTVLFEAPDTDSPKGKFVVIKDDLNPDRPYKFQLKANNGQVLYESESFKIKPRAKQIEVFRNTINNGTSTIDSEKNGTFRYKLFKADGSLYGVGEGYKTRASAESALESVKNFCNTSNTLEDTTAEDKK